MPQSILIDVAGDDDSPPAVSLSPIQVPDPVPEQQQTGFLLVTTNKPLYNVNESLEIHVTQALSSEEIATIMIRNDNGNINTILQEPILPDGTIDAKVKHRRSSLEIWWTIHYTGQSRTPRMKERPLLYLRALILIQNQ